MGQLPVTGEPSHDRSRPRVRRPERDRSDRDRPALPSTTSDEQDVGWGDEPGDRSDDWYRRERPPHHE